jgi:hypothetical protein
VQKDGYVQKERDAQGYAQKQESVKKQEHGHFQRSRRNLGLLLFVPFLLFPVLDSNMYPLRMSLYAFLELLLLTELYFYKEEKQGNKKGFWLRIALLGSVVTVWRTEAVYYIVLLPLLLLYMCHIEWKDSQFGNYCNGSDSREDVEIGLNIDGKKCKRDIKRKWWKRIILYLICAVILFVPQKIGEKITSGSQYELTSVVLPLVPLVVEADRQGETELLAQIDQVVNVPLILEKAPEGKSGISMFWSEPEFQRDYSAEEFSAFKAAYYKLILKYPLVFAKERMQTFVQSTGLLENTTELFTAEGVANYDTFRTYPLTAPLSDGLRTSVIKILELRSMDSYEEKLPIADVVYSAIPAIVIILIAFVILIAKRKWKELFLVMCVLVKVPLVFLTAPSKLFMYYYSVYLFGYFLLFYVLYLYIGRKIRQ